MMTGMTILIEGGKKIILLAKIILIVAFLSWVIVAISFRGDARILQFEENYRAIKRKEMSDQKFNALRRRVNNKSKLMWLLIIIIAIAMTFAYDY